MPIRSIRGLGVKGLILDQDPYDVPMDALSDGNNVAVVDGKISRMTGAVVKHEGSWQHIAPWFQPDNQSYILIGDSEWRRYTTASIYADVTPTESINGTKWRSQSAGRFLIVNNEVDPPFVMGPTSSAFAPMTNWPTDLQCEVIKPYSGYLVAIGLTEGGTDQPFVVRWSDAVIPGTLQPDWDYTSTTNLAGRNELAGGDGAIRDMLQLADQNILYLDNGVYAMQYVGGQFVFSFRKLFDDDGILTQGAVVEFQGKHLVVGNDDIYIHDGSTKKSISDGRVSRFFRNALRNIDSVRVERVISRDEIWILFSDSDDVNANRALVYNYIYDAWTKFDLAVPAKQVVVGPRTSSGIETWVSQQTWDDRGQETWDVDGEEVWTPDQTWSGQNDRWNSLDPTGTGTVPYLVADNAIWQADTGYDWDGTELPAFIEQSKLDLDQLFGETETLKKIKRILPQMDGTGTVEFSVGTSATPLASVDYIRSANFQLDTDHKVDLRAQGRYLAIKMEMAGSGNFEMTGWDVDVERGHGR
jgi:hypothetical protein